MLLSFEAQGFFFFPFPTQYLFPKKEHLEMDGWLKRKRHCLQTAHNLMMTEKGKLITV